MIADSRVFRGAFAFAFAIMAVVCLFTATTPPVHAQSAGETGAADVWYRSYILNKLASEKEKSGDYLEALNAYNDALPLLKGVAEKYPTFHPDIVKARIRLIEESRKVLTDKLSVKSNPPTPKNIANAPQPGETRQLNPNPELRNWPGNPNGTPPATAPTGVAPTPYPQQPVTPPTSYPPQQQTAGSLVEFLVNQEREQKARIDWQNQQISALSQKLQQSEQRFAQSQTELNRALSSETQLKADVAAAGNEEEWAQLVDELTAELDTSNALNKRLLVELKASRNEVATLKEEISMLKSNRDTTIEGEELQKLVKKNEELRDQVEKIEKYAQSVQELNREKNEEIVFLKRELADVNQKWQSVKELNEQYQSRIEELRNKLMMFEQGLNSEEALLLADANPVVAAENDLLKGVVVKQIQRQAQRKMATDLLLAQLDKVGARTASLDALLEEIATSETLTETEKSLFKGQNISELIKDAESRAQSWQPPAEPKIKIVSAEGETELQDLAKELAQIQATARMDFVDGHFAEAEKSYGEFLKYRPNNVPCLCNLALVKITVKDYDQAQEYLKKAINLKNNSGFAHYLLGRTYFEQGRNEDALASLETGLSHNPRNANAHNFVGVIASQKGWMKRAEQSFTQALEINPDFGDAHFNLALLFTTGDEPDPVKAKNHYFKALRLKVPRDAAIENFLKDQNNTTPESDYPEVELPVAEMTVGMVH